VSGSFLEQMSFREDPLLHVPVTSRTSNVTYANYQCAVCHSDTHDVVFWNVDLKCPSLIGPSEVEVNASPGDLVFREGQWGVVVNGSEQEVHKCNLTLSLGNIWKFPGRSCRLVVDKCMENWHDETTEKLCHSYTSHVNINGEVYKNSFCAIYNVSSTYVGCYSWKYPSVYPMSSTIPIPFTVLADYRSGNGNNNVGKSVSWIRSPGSIGI